MTRGIESLQRLLHRHFLYRGVVTLRGEGSVFHHLDDLKSKQFESRSSLEGRREARLGGTLKIARERVAYYRDAWRDIAVDDRESAVEQLARLPLLSKAQLQQNFLRLAVSPLPSRVTRKTTGGSTGQAVTVLKDREALAREMAATWLAYGWFGVEIGDKSARFWGNPHTWQRRLRSAAVRIAVRRINFSAFAFNDTDLDRYYAKALAYRPAFLYGYVSMLEAFARRLKQMGIDGRNLGLKSVVTTSEVLGEPQRRLLSDVFGVPVQNEYGCGEVGPIAYDCERGSLHIVAENLVVELLLPDGSPAGPGEDGEVVVTDLANSAMPLIRYRVGDFASWGDECPCGRAWPVLKRVWGRAYDFVEAQDGRRYHGEYLMYIFEDLKDSMGGVPQFQVVQRTRESLDVSIVDPCGLDSATEAAVVEAFAARFPDMKVNVHVVAGITRTPSGKLRLIQNLLHDPDAT